MECDIEKMWVEGEDLEQYFYDANDMKRTVISTESDIDFSVRSVILMPKQVAVHFDLTPGATISPENGSVQDFSDGDVIYTVTAEDGRTTRVYRVGFREVSQAVTNRTNSLRTMRRCVMVAVRYFITVSSSWTKTAINFQIYGLQATRASACQ